jgi:hypothetical protein
VALYIFAICIPEFQLYHVDAHGAIYCRNTYHIVLNCIHVEAKDAIYCRIMYPTVYVSCILPQYVSYSSKLCHGEARRALNCRMMYPCLGLLLVEWYVAPGGLFQVLSIVLHVVDLEQEKRDSQARIS